MKNIVFLQKVYILLLILVINNIVFSQWQQTNGIRGGNFRVIAGTSDNLLAVTGYGTVFHYSNNQWSYRSTTNYADEIYLFNNKWIGFNNNSIILSEDDGLTWQNIILLPPSSFIQKAKIVDNTIYALTIDSLYSTTDLGVTWIKRAIGTNIIAGTDTGTFFIQRSFYAKDSIMIASGFSTVFSNFNVVAYSNDYGQSWIAANFPESVQNVFVKDIQYGGDFYYLTNENGFYKSINGVDWEEINDGLTITSGSMVFTKIATNNGGLIAIMVSPNYGLYAYDGNIWSLIYDESYLSDVCINDNTLIFCTSSDIIKYDQINFKSLTSDIIATSSKPVVSSNGYVFSIYNSKLYRTSNKGFNWDLIKDSSSSVLVTNNDTLFSLSISGILRSVDNGNDWNALNSGIPSSHISKVSSVGLANGMIYAGINGTRSRTHLPPVWEQGGVYVSSNNGESWSSLNSGLPQEGGVPAPVYQIYAEGNLVILYTIAGRFSLINNSWVNIGFGFPANTYVTNTTIFKDKIIFTTTNGLFISHDKGITKESFNNGLTAVPYYSALLFTYKDEIYFLITEDNQLYKYEVDQWELADLNLPQNLRYTFISSVGDLIYAGTYDNGIWRFDPSATNAENNIVPDGFGLSQNYPNPFNPGTIIKFNLPVESKVKLTVYDILGKEVATLIDDNRSAGEYQINFNASFLASGTYIYRLEAGEFIETKKMLLLK